MTSLSWFFKFYHFLISAYGFNKANNYFWKQYRSMLVLRGRFSTRSTKHRERKTPTSILITESSGVRLKSWSISRFWLRRGFSLLSCRTIRDRNVFQTMFYPSFPNKMSTKFPNWLGFQPGTQGLIFGNSMPNIRPCWHPNFS